MLTQEELQITHQAVTYTIALDLIVARFGDTLNNLTVVEKLDLLAILAFWQSSNACNLEFDSKPNSLREYLNLEPALQDCTSQDVDQALQILADCSENDSLTLMKVIVNQLHDYRQS